MDGWRRFGLRITALVVCAGVGGAAVCVCLTGAPTIWLVVGTAVLFVCAAVLTAKLLHSVKRLRALTMAYQSEYASDPIRAEPDKIVQKLIDDIVQFYKDELDAGFWKKEMELSAMQSQINPHFLYNTLDCIRGQAVHEKFFALARMIENLSTFFRYSISFKEDLVTVGDELENVKNYFEIQKYRFGERIALHIDVANDASLEQTLPKMTMQPLVENAIFHGLEGVSREGWVDIRISRTQNSMQISVEDNGVGMIEEEVRRLNRMFEQSRTIEPEKRTQKRSIAMNNVNRRLKLFFGEEYGLHIFSTPNVGTEVRMTLPCARGEAV